jgi:hypothetical protein
MRKGQPSTVAVGGKEFEVAPSPELTSTEVKSTANKLFKIASPITSAAPKIPQSPVMDGVVKPTDEAAISNLSPKAASGNEDVLTEYISTLNEADQNRLRGSKMNDEQSFEILTKAYAPRLEQAVIDLSILRDRGVDDDLKAIDDSQKQMQTLTQTISADKTALVDLQATFLKQKGYDKISSEYKSINKQLQVKQTELAPLFKEQQQLETTLKQFESLIQDGNFVGNEQEYNAYQETYKAYEQLTQSPELANYNNLVKKQNEISSSINSMVTPEYKAQEEKLLGRINTTVASANTLMQNSQGLLTPEKIENIELYKQTVEEYNSITNKLQTAKSKMPDVIEKEAYINAMNAAVKDNPYLKAFDLSAKAIGGFTEAVGSLLSAVPSFTGGMSNEYTFSDKVSESITNFFAPSITNTQTTTAGRPSAAYQPFYDSEIDHINWSSLPDEIANQAGAFAVLAGSGVLGGMAKFSEISSVVVPGALISYNDAYKTGREIYGDDAFSATAYATASSLITGITELIMPDRDILTGGSVDKIAKNYVVNYAKKGKRFAIERSLLDLTEMMGKEVTEEFADRWKDVLLKGVVNMTGGDIDNDIPTLNEQLSIAASTAALTGGVGAFSQRGKNSKARQLAVYQSAKSYPETITMLNTMEQEGYDADRIDAIKSEVTNMFVTLKEVPADLSAPKRIAIAEKLNTIKKIEDAMASGISPFIADRMNDSIKKISDDIQNIITDPNYDEVFGKEVNEDVAKSEDVTVTGMPVVEITPTTEEMMVEGVEVIVPSEEVVAEVKDVPKKEESGIAELNAAGKELFFEKPIRKEYEEGVDGDNKYAQDNIAHNEKVDNLILSINQNGTLIDSNGIEYDVEVTSQGVRVSPKTQNDLKVYARGKRVSGSTPFTAGFKFIPATTTTTTTETVTPVAEEAVITEPAQSEAVKEDATTNTTTDKKETDKGQKELLSNATEDAAPIPEAPPLTPTETVVKETTPSAPKIFVSKKGNSIEKDAEGKVIVRDKKGKELSGRERSLAIGEFVREKIASKAGRISDKQLEEDNVTEQNIAQYISENSKNAGQILEAIANLRPDETAVERDRIIEEAMTGISEESFNRHSDRNLMTDTIRKNYIRKEGRDIDEIAQSASYAMFPDGDGTEISVEDVVEFIHNYPSGYKGKSFDPNKKALYDAFEQLTGVRPTPAMVRSLSSKKQMENDEDFAGLEPVETEGATVTVEGKEKEASFPKRVIADKKTSGQTKAKIDSARTYLEQKNIMSIGEATATIREIGAEAAEALVRDPLSEINGGVRGVMTQMLINYYDQNGEYEKSADLIRWAKQRLVDQGQEIQSYSLWNALRVGYTIQDSEIEYEKATGRKLPEYLRDRFEKIGEQVAKYEKRIAELEAIQKDKALDEAVGNIKDSIDRENKKPSTRKKNELSAEKKSRKAALRAKFGGIFNDFTNIPRLLLDKEFIEYNKLILEEAAGDFRNFVRLIVDGLGKKARPYAREFYKAAGGTELPDLEKAFVDDNGALKIPNEIIREIVAAGVTSADDLTEKVKEAIIKDVPDVTDREVKEAITQYGKTVNPSKDELDAEIRKLKRDGRLELGLDDAKEGKGVKRTGLQRDKPTDYQRELQRKINEELKKYPQDQQSVEKKWASALDRTKTHLKNTIADLNKRISDIKEGIAEPLPSKKRGFELDEEAKQLQEERDELKKILAELEPKQEMSDEARVKVALAAAERAITATADKINAQEFEYKKKKEPLNTPELVAARERLKLGKDVLNRMREESGFAEQHRYDLWKKRIQKRISDLQEKIDNKDFSVAPKKVMEINQEILELRVKADKLKFERDVEIEKARINSLTGLQKLKQIALDVINLPKSLMASADLSAPLRQGALLTARHPVMGLAAAKEMMKQAFSQKAQDKWVAALHESEIYPYMKHAKLFLSEPSVDLTAKEEQYISNIAEKIPVWGRVVKGSGRAYNGYLNKLRADVFSQFFYALKQEGVTGAELETQLKSYAKFINNATGRGDLGIGETSALVLNSAFFSPRYVASRFNLLNPVFYAKLEPRTRMEALKTMGTYVGVVSMTLALLSAMGDDDDDFTVELDPRSSDFAKLKWGDTRFDLLAGFQQWVRMFAQIVTGQKKSTTTGEVVTLGEGYKSDTRLDVLRKFFISKAAPAAAAGMNILRGKDMMGEPITPEGELLKLAIPLYVSDMYEVYKEEGIGKSVATTLPAFFGVGVQTYGKDKKQPTTREEVQEEMNRRLEKKAEAEMKKEARDNNPKIQKQKDKKEADEDALYERAKKYGIEYVK